MFTTLALAAAISTTSYRVAMPDPASHFFNVEVRYEQVKAPLRFAFPAFSPGAWTIDEVAKNVLDLGAIDGGRTILPAVKIDKQTWEIGKPKDGTVVVSYRVYANEKGTAYTARVNAAMAHANLVRILGYAPERQRARARLTVAPADGWKVACSLAPVASESNTFDAPDFDQLADGIFLAGNFTELSFDEGGARYRLVFSRAPDFKDRKFADDVRKFAREAAGVFGETPFDRYLFLYLLEPDGGHGGIEHLFGTSICAPLDSFEDRETYRKLLGVSAHELVHAWNVKRMRPAGLGPFDYARESPTHDLFVAEGFTSYYGNLSAVRGGAFTRDEYFKALAEGLVTDRDNVGIRAKSLEEHSWDWWIGSDIPYLTYRTNYTRGALVALVLDLELRDVSGGQRSLDDAMKTLYRETGARATGYTGDELRTALTRGGAAGMDARLDAMVRIPGPLDVAAALARAGLEVVPDPATPAAPFTGWRTSSKGKDFPVLDWVEPDSPAARAGLQDGDLVVALGERRLVAERLDKELGLLKPGQPVGISFFRDGTLRRLELTPGAPVPPKLIVRPRADAGPGQKALLDAWLGLPSSPAPAP